MIEGTLPSDFPKGILYRNGPGLLETPDGKPIDQPFDGDGYVCAFRFGDQITFSSRFVKTEGYVKEKQAGKALYRGVFSVGNPTDSWFYNPLDIKPKNIANTGVVRWGDRLLALWEGGGPHRLDPETLETTGTCSLDGVLPEGQEFAAHYRHYEDRLVNFGVSALGGRDLRIRVWEFAEGSFEVLRPPRVPWELPGGCVLVDHVVVRSPRSTFASASAFPAHVPSRPQLHRYLCSHATSTSILTPTRHPQPDPRPQTCCHRTYGEGEHVR